MLLDCFHHELLVSDWSMAMLVGFSDTIVLPG
jgi:hypothetical protein